MQRFGLNHRRLLRKRWIVRAEGQVFMYAMTNQGETRSRSATASKITILSKVKMASPRFFFLFLQFFGFQTFSESFVEWGKMRVILVFRGSIRHSENKLTGRKPYVRRAIASSCSLVFTLFWQERSAMRLLWRLL